MKWREEDQSEWLREEDPLVLPHMAKGGRLAHGAGACDQGRTTSRSAVSHDRGRGGGLVSSLHEIEGTYFEFFSATTVQRRERQLFVACRREDVGSTTRATT